MKSSVATYLLQKYGKSNPPKVEAGDTVRVHQKIKEGDKERVQIFEGLVISVKHGYGLDGTFTVRKIAAGGIGVERTYPLHSPSILKVERTKKAEVKRAKLYYMRGRQGKAARLTEVGARLVWAEPEAEAEEAAIEEAQAEQHEREEAEEALEQEKEEAVKEVEAVIEGAPVEAAEVNETKEENKENTKKQPEAAAEAEDKK